MRSGREAHWSSRARTGCVAAAALAMLSVVSGCAEEPAQGEAVAEEVADSIEAISPVALRELPAGFNADQVELGRQSYVVCSVCHGLDGLGTPLGPSLRDSTWIHIGGTAPEIEQIIRSGVPEPQEFPAPMPAMGGGSFTAEQIQALVAYVHALSQS
jgi:mono/diheme cytochrome c family protein